MGDRLAPSNSRAIKITIFISRSHSIVSTTLPISVYCRASGVKLFEKILPTPGRKPSRLSTFYLLLSPSTYESPLQTSFLIFDSRHAVFHLLHRLVTNLFQHANQG